MEPTRLSRLPDMLSEGTWDSRLIGHISPEHSCCHSDCPIAAEFKSCDDDQSEEQTRGTETSLHRRVFNRVVSPNSVGGETTRTYDTEQNWYDLPFMEELVGSGETEVRIVSVERDDSGAVSIWMRVGTRRKTDYNRNKQRWNHEIVELTTRLRCGESLLVVDEGYNMSDWYTQNAFVFTLCACDVAMKSSFTEGAPLIT